MTDTAIATLERKLISKLVELKEVTLVWEMGLRAEVFEEPINRRVFQWMLDYWLEHRMQHAPTWLVMEQEFPAVPLLTEVEEPTEWLVEHLRRRWVINQGQDIIERTIPLLTEDPYVAMSMMWHDAYDITETTTPRLARVDLSQNAAERREAYIRKNAFQEMGMTLGIPELDTHTRGVLPGELAVVAGYTKTGKSWLLALAAVAARRAGHTPLLMTLEQGITEMGERIDALWSGVSYTRLQQGSLTFEEMDKLRAARAEIDASGPFLVEKPQRGDRTVKTMANRCRQIGADYLIVDQLAWMDAEREYKGDRSMTQKHTDLIFDLKDEINRESAGRLPCFLAVQFNRETMRDKAAGGKGELYNFAHSSMIEQTADLCLGIWRSPEMRNNNSMGVAVIGARRCDLREWLLAWYLGERTEIRVRPAV